MVAVLVLLGAAAAVATPKGRLPLALRGVKKLMRQDRGETAADPSAKGVPVSSRRRLLAFVLVIAAVITAVV